MKTKVVVALVLALMLTTVIMPTVFAADYEVKLFYFTLSDKSGSQSAYEISTTTIKKSTTRKYAAVKLTGASPTPTHTIRTCIVDEPAQVATTSLVWYTYGGSFAKPKFTSPSGAKGDYHRAAMRLNTDETRDHIDCEGQFTVDYSN